MQASMPCAAQAPAMSAWSVATMMRAAPASRARSATRTTIGRPARSASGLFGSRVEARRAGMMTTKLIGSQRRLDLARLVGPHDRDAVADRIGQAVAPADQFLRFLVIFERSLAQRADQDIKQSGVHDISPRCEQPAQDRSGR